MVPDSTTLFCRDARRALSGSRGCLRDNEEMDEGVWSGTSRPISRLPQAASAAARSPSCCWMVVFTCKDKE